MEQISIKDLIKHKKIGLYRIDIIDRFKMIKVLQDSETIKLLRDSKITYTYTIYSNYIALVLYKYRQIS